MSNTRRPARGRARARPCTRGRASGCATARPKARATSRSACPRSARHRAPRRTELGGLKHLSTRVFGRFCARAPATYAGPVLALSRFQPTAESRTPADPPARTENQTGPHAGHGRRRGQRSRVADGADRAERGAAGADRAPVRRQRRPARRRDPLAGHADAVRLAERVLTELIALIARGQGAARRDFATIVRVLRDHPEVELADVMQPIVVNAGGGRQITPRGAGAEAVRPGDSRRTTSCSASARPARARPTWRWRWRCTRSLDSASSASS